MLVIQDIGTFTDTIRKVIIIPILGQVVWLLQVDIMVDRMAIHTVIRPNTQDKCVTCSSSIEQVTFLNAARSSCTHFFLRCLSYHSMAISCALPRASL